MKTIHPRVVMIILLLASYAFTYSQGKKDLAGSQLQIDSFRLRKESRFLLNIHGGYNVGLGSTFRFYPDDVTTIDVVAVDNTTSLKNVTYKANSKGLGDGFRYGMGLSYILNDFINLGIDLDYFRSTIRKTRDSTATALSSSSMLQTTYAERYTISYDASLLTITPHATFKAISRPGFFIYNKVGAVITIRPNSIQRERQDIRSTNSLMGPSGDSTSYSEKKYDWGLRNPALGFMGGIGSQVRVTRKFRAFAEIQFTHVLFKVRSRTLTKFDVDGNEKINTLSVSERKIEFEKKLTSDELNTNPDSPTKLIIQRFPVTYIGAQLGLVYRL